MYLQDLKILNKKKISLAATDFRISYQTVLLQTGRKCADRHFIDLSPKILDFDKTQTIY